MKTAAAEYIYFTNEAQILKIYITVLHKQYHIDPVVDRSS